MLKNRRVAVLVLLVLGLLQPGYASEETLRTFDACWHAVKQSFYDRELHGLDWGQIRQRYRPLADRARPGAELRAVLTRLLMELKASIIKRGSSRRDR